MKTLVNLSFILFFTVFAFFLNQNELNATPSAEPNSVSSSQLPPDFEWRDEYFTVYWNHLNNTPTSVTSPYYSDAIGELLFTKDYEPEDGWVFVTGNFGSNQGYIADPYFIMYNRYEGLLRVFVLVNSTENYSNASMKLSFGTSAQTALLTHAYNRAWAVDNFKHDNIMLATTDMFNYNWLYADFAMAYDPNSSLIANSWLSFNLMGVTLTNLTINGTINLTQELPKSTINSENLSIFDQISVAGKKVAGYYSTFNGYKSQLAKQTNKEKDGNLKTALVNLSNSWIVKDLPFIGAAVGLVDFFVGGGRNNKTESPVPMVFNGDMTLEGTLVTNDQITQFTMPTPGTNHGNITDNIPYYDKPLGIFNLTETPVLQWRDYYQPEGGGPSMQYESYKVKNDIHYAINPNANLDLHSLDVALVFRFNATYYEYPPSGPELPGISNWVGQGIYEIESSEISNHYVLRTKYIPYNLFKNTVINVPFGTDVTIKVKADLKRNDAPSGTQDVIFVADYEPTWEEVTTGSGSFPWSSNQLFPSKPRNLSCSFSSSNHPVLNWDLGVGIEKYEIWKSYLGVWSKLAEVGPSVYQYEDITETRYNIKYGNKIYKYYKIKAFDYANNPSIYSDKVFSVVNDIMFKSGLINGDFDYTLFNNYPNPFNPTTQISYQIPKDGVVNLVVYNTLGQKVATLVNEMQESGVYAVNFNAENLPSGIYIYKLQSGIFSEVKKMLLLK